MSDIEEEPEFDPEPHLSIIPAAPGLRALYDDADGLFAGEDIIGWRVQTHWDQGEHHSMVEAILTSGMAGSRMSGMLHPDGTVTWARQRHASMDEANAARVRVQQMIADKTAQLAGEEKAR